MFPDSGSQHIIAIDLFVIAKQINLLQFKLPHRNDMIVHPLKPTGLLQLAG